MVKRKVKVVFAIVGLILIAGVSAIAGFKIEGNAYVDSNANPPVYVGTTQVYSITGAKLNEFLNDIKDLDNLPWRYSAYYSVLGGTHKAFAYVPYTAEEAIWDYYNGDLNAIANYQNQSKSYWVWYTIPATGYTPSGQALYGGAEKYPTLVKYFDTPIYDADGFPSIAARNWNGTVRRDSNASAVFGSISASMNNSCDACYMGTSTEYGAIGYNTIAVWMNGYHHIQGLPLVFDDNFKASSYTRVNAGYMLSGNMTVNELYVAVMNGVEYANLRARTSAIPNYYLK